MNRNGQIILIEDDPDDIDIIRTAIGALELPNEVIVFNSGAGVVSYLTGSDTDPMLVISDVNLPGQHGVDLYKELAAQPAFVIKNIPFVFLSTSAEHAPRAAEVSKCGYFVKPRDYFDYVNIVQRVVLYWNTVEYK